jgi:hypothetical protein
VEAGGRDGFLREGGVGGQDQQPTQHRLAAFFMSGSSYKARCESFTGPFSPNEESGPVKSRYSTSNLRVATSLAVAICTT